MERSTKREKAEGGKAEVERRAKRGGGVERGKGEGGKAEGEEGGAARGKGEGGGAECWNGILLGEFKSTIKFTTMRRCVEKYLHCGIFKGGFERVFKFVIFLLCFYTCS